MARRLTFDDSRKRFLDSTAQITVCVGDRAECDHLVKKGGRYFKWEAKIPSDVLASTRVVHLRPTAAQARSRRLPDFLHSLEQVRTLSLPHPLAADVGAGRIPAGVDCLTIIFDDRLERVCPVQDTRWYSQNAMPGVRGLFFLATMRQFSPWQQLMGSRHQFPSLQFFGASANGGKTPLDVLQSLAGLEHCELDTLGNADALSAIPPKTRFLSLAGAGKAFSFSELPRLSRIEALVVNGASCGLDCRCLLELPRLAEVQVLNTRQLSNIGALLEVSSLRRVRFLDCGKPFRGEMSQRFESRGFEHCDIRFA